MLDNAPTSPRASTDSSQPLHVLIVYDEQPAYQRALRMLVGTLSGEADVGEVRPLPWRFTELAREPWRKRAMDDSLRADIFIVSTSGDQALSGDTARWIEESFALRQSSPAAVVVLDDPTQGMDRPESESTQFVRRAAMVAGLDFLETRAPAKVGAC